MWPQQCLYLSLFSPPPHLSLSSGGVAIIFPSPPLPTLLFNSNALEEQKGLLNSKFLVLAQKKINFFSAVQFFSLPICFCALQCTVFIYLPLTHSLSHYLLLLLFPGLLVWIPFKFPSYNIKSCFVIGFNLWKGREMLCVPCNFTHIEQVHAWRRIVLPCLLPIKSQPFFKLSNALSLDGRNYFFAASTIPQVY